MSEWPIADEDDPDVDDNDGGYRDGSEIGNLWLLV